MKRMMLICLLLSVVFMAVTGCTKSGPVSPPSTETPVPTIPQELVFNAATDPPTLDPQVNTISHGSLVLNNMFEGLVRTTCDNEQVPGVAQSWDISPDGLTYTFSIRADSRWSDGKSVTASDFVYAWLRALDPANKIKYVNHMFYIKNARGVYQGVLPTSDLGVRVVDERTLVVELEAPTPYMLEMFSFGVYRPVRKDVVEANPTNWTNTPATCVSNGPFKLTQYTMNDKIVLTRDENYWDKDRVKLDRLTFVFINEAQTALAAFNAGEIDGFLNVPSQQITQLLMQSDELHIMPRLRVTYVTFNNKAYPFDNPKVREAFTKAIDRKQIAEQVIGAGEQPASGFVPYGMVVGGRDFRETNGDFGILPAAMVDEARAALAEAGYPNGKGWPAGVEYLYNTNDQNKRIAEAMQQMWKTNLNVDIKLVNVESAVHSSRRFSGDYQFGRAGWGADFNHPMTFLDVFTSTAGNNSPQYHVKEYDDLIDRAKLAIDPKEGFALLLQAEQKLMNDWAVCPLVYATQTIMIKKHVKGWDVTPFGDINFDELWIGD